MEAFFQGKVDNFCAIYAVLNALRLSCGISVYAARELFNATLLDLGRDETAFRAVLEHKTDYIWLVDQMLEKAAGIYPLKVCRPFAHATAGCAEVWACLAHWLQQSEHHTAVLRFCRYLPLQDKPTVDHWSTALRMAGDNLHLLDASLEAAATRMLPLERTKSSVTLMSSEFFIVPPQALRLIAKV